MSYDHYLNLKNRGKTSAFLLKDHGIKVFPLCLNIRKFIHQEQNHFIQLNLSFEILFDMENYYSIGYYLFASCHHQSHLNSQYDRKEPYFSIKKEPLYEYGNEEEYLPEVDMISVVQTEAQMLEVLKPSFLLYEKEQNFLLWNNFVINWEYNKQHILQNKNKKITKQVKDAVEWHNIYKLCERSEHSLKNLI